MPQISVIIPMYDSAATIARAIESALAQTAGDLEIICVDDGSADRSVAIARGYGARVRVLTQENRGPSAARNAGARAASGDLVLFLDADDFLRPAMLARCAEELRANADCVLAYTNAEIVDDSGRVLRVSMVSAARAHPPAMDELLAHIWPIVPSTAMIRRSAFEAAGGFNEALRSCEDIHFWLLAREHGSFIYIPEVLAAKTEDKLFPKILERDAGAHQFARLVRQRYGNRGAGLLREFSRMKARLLEQCGAEAVRAGNLREARRCFAHAIGYQPSRLVNYLRVLKTLATPGAPAGILK
ncbi:MAG: glycosyltransferase [Candidatus Binataceae bacterium]